MGNRAVIGFGEGPKDLGIYLHWNGGRDSVEAFLEAAKRLKCRDDGDYGFARLVQIIGNYFGGTTSVGVGTLDQLDCDNCDNGLYIVDNAFNITGRKYNQGNEQREYELEKMVQEVMEKNPMFSKGF